MATVQEDPRRAAHATRRATTACWCALSAPVAATTAAGRAVRQSERDAPLAAASLAGSERQRARALPHASPQRHPAAQQRLLRHVRSMQAVGDAPKLKMTLPDRADGEAAMAAAAAAVPFLAPARAAEHAARGYVARRGCVAWGYVLRSTRRRKERHYQHASAFVLAHSTSVDRFTPPRPRPRPPPPPPPPPCPCPCRRRPPSA